MATENLSWDLLRSFLGVMRHGSLSAAARALHLTQPTLGRHIAQLEAELGGPPLFTRSPAGLIATAAAQELRSYAEAMEASAAAIVRAARSDAAQLRGVVRVTASEIIGTEVLPALLRRFRSGYPAVSIEVELSNAVADLLRRDADIAVRMTRPEQKQLLAKHIGKVPLGLHAHRRYLESHGAPVRVEDLAHHAVIGFDRPPSYIKSIRGLPDTFSRDFFSFRADSDIAQLAAIRAGIGIGVCQTGIARRDPNLVPLLPREFSSTLDIWLVMHADQRKSAHIKAMFDVLAEGLAEYVSASR